jgi:SNF2 family DNA or RNA helicase
LQARDDSSIVIPASEVWQANRNSLRINNRRFEQPQERLLAGLGIASRLFSPIQESLRSPRPEVAFLSTEEAYQFLREIGPLLESSGFAVMYPDWWQPGNRTRLGLRLRLFGGDEPQIGDDGPDTWFQQEGPGPKQQSPLNLSNLIRFKWELTLGDSTLDQAEFEQLAARRSPLVNIRGRWVELDPQQISAARNFLTSNQPEGHMNLLQAVRVAQKHLGAEHGVDAVTGSFMDTGLLSPDHDGLETDGLPVDTVDVDGWLRETMDRLRGLEPVKELGEPEGFVGTLRPYQRRGVGWLWFLRQLGLGSCLADDMGLGKTIQAIGLLLYARQRARAAEPSVRVQPALLICPTSLVANWRHEIERFAPGLKPLIHHGTSRLDGDDFMEALNDYDIVITSYGTARRDIELLTAIEWSDLILDEAQNIKNPGAKQTQAVRQIQARNRIALTGTPVENRLLELWSIMEFLNPGYLDNRERFRHKYVLPIERYNDAQVSRELRQLVQPFLLRRLKTDPTIISDLPEKNEMVVYCPLTREQAQLYETVVQDTMRKVEESEGIQRRGIVLSLLMKLKQVCNHPAHFLKEDGPLPGRSGKLSRLTEMLEEALSVGDKALVFTQFVEMGHLLKRHLEDSLNCEVLFLHGGTPAPKRDQLVEAFQQEENGPSVFILSLRAGGVGLNLTRANQVFHFDRWWNPAVENQATDRAFRIGQRRSVQVYKFVVAGTLEERIHELIESKQALAENIVGSGEDWLTDISADELRKLLALRMDEIDG